MIDNLLKQTSWKNPLRVFAQGVGVLLSLAGALHAQSPAGTVITNVATVNYTNNGIPAETERASVSFVVGVTGSLDINPPHTVTTLGGSRVVLTHTVANRANMSDNVTIGAVVPSGWTAKLYIDSNRDGKLDTNDQLITGALALASGEAVDVLVVVDVAPRFAAGRNEQIVVSAQSEKAPNTSVSVRDVFTGFKQAGALLSLTKAADPFKVEPGATIRYTLMYGTSDNGDDARNVEMRDVLPAGVTLVPNSLRLNEAPANSAGSAHEVVLQLGTVRAGTGGVIQFDVVVDSSAVVGSEIVNEANIYEKGAPTKVTAVASSRVIEPSAALVLTKSVDRAEAAAGDVLTYSIDYRVSGLGSLENVIISDQLPEGTTLVATPSNAEVDGNVVRFRLGALARNAAGTLELQVNLADNLTAGARIANVAAASFTNRGAQGASASNEAVTTIKDAAASLQLAKTVDQANAEAGSTLKYTIAFDVVGSGRLTNVNISDVLPGVLTYVAGSLRVNGATPTRADVSGGMLNVSFDQLARDTRGTIEFQANVAESAIAGARITNVAHGTFSTLGQPGEPVVDSATTRAATPQFTITKTLLTSATAWKGSDVKYRIFVRNTGVLPLRDIVITDTLPAELSFVSSLPVANVNQRVLTWQPSDLAVGDSIELIVAAKVNESINARTTVTNVAYLTASHASGNSSATLTVESGSEMQLSIKLASDKLEVSQGEIAPLTAEVTNTGWANLNDVVIELLLPEGTTFVPGSLVGADSILVQSAQMVRSNPGIQKSVLGDNTTLATSWSSRPGGRLIVRLPAMLAVGSSAKFRYSIAVIAPKSSTLQNASIATAENQSVFSNESSLMLRMNRNRAVETLNVIGNVWLDDNGNGRIEADEKPAANVDVWSEDGAVARTDSLGKFSFSNLRPGTHVFRVDPNTTPAGFAADTADDGLVRVRLTGWTTPRVLFGLRALTDNAQRVMPAPPVALVKSDSIEEPVRVAPMRTEKERAAMKSRALLTGPSPEIFGLVDGIVSSDRKIFLGVRAEPASPVALFRGDSLIVEDKLRPDGVYDFLGIALKSGPNKLRVRVTNSWKNDVWDSVMVHVSGTPASMQTTTPSLTVAADGSSIVRVRVRILDKWGVPVVNKPFLTVSADGAAIATPDAYASASGNQVQVDEQGWATIAVRGGLKVRRGTLRMESADAHLQIPIEMIAPTLPFMLIGSGEIGVGSGAAEGFAAITARGTVADRTALTVSIDTRRVENGDQAFGRTVDPLSDGHYPITGDASQQRIESASRSTVSARLERGLDFLAFGDVKTGIDAEDVTLTRYMRALTGASGAVTTGRFKWSGFGAYTSQALQQVQLRGRGISGPYQLNGAVIPGTERVEIQVRDRDNAQRIKNRQALVAYLDYEIDYVTGNVMLKRPLGAVDGSGNLMFLVVTAETAGAGERKPVWGGRVNTSLKFATVGASIISDNQGVKPARLVGLDVNATPLAGVALHAEVAHSEAGDSAGYAALISGTASLLSDALQFSARWSHTGDGFANPSNVALNTTTQDLQVGVGVRLLRGELRLDHARQDFMTQGVVRNRTSMSIRQPLLAHTEFEARFSHDAANGTHNQETGAGEFKFTWTPSTRMKVWAESRSEVWSSGQTSTGDYVGAGAALQITRELSIEARHLELSRGNEKGYSLTHVGVKSNLMTGSQAWGSYQIVGGVDAATSAAIVGLNNRWTVAKDLRLNTLFERRVGIDRAPTEDPVRALPFPQQDNDYWSAGLGLEFTPERKPYRLSAKAERKNGAEEKTVSGLISGDYSLNGTLAILSRQEFNSRETGATAQFAQPKSQHASSIVGLAFRPTDNDKLNGLVELRYVSDENPRGNQLLDRGGADVRMIGAAEMIWSPSNALEIGGRFATRQSRQTIATTGLPDAIVRSSAEFMSLRADLNLNAFAAVRGESRMLREQRADDRAWDIAPALVLRPVQGIELSGGYRWGALRDADFAVNGGAGFFMTMGVRMTEASLPSAASFWRNRIGH